MKTQYSSKAHRAPSLVVLLTVSAGLLCFMKMEDGTAPLGVVSAGTTNALTTTFVSSTSRSGQMFDVHSTETVRVDDFSCNVDGPANSLLQYRIYSRVGSYEFKTQIPQLWTLQAEGQVLSMGSDVPTRLGATLDLVLPEGQITGFYVTLTSGDFEATDTPSSTALPRAIQTSQSSKALASRIPLV